ncbi:MAG: hypothetical protein Ct9H300mP13_0370 [Gammaproteobacteria bacterium]|nr:MAG: hypothetical protein Ct9H300mP13_0370 [Gammaproteobacteria bacterium]
MGRRLSNSSSPRSAGGGFPSRGAGEVARYHNPEGIRPAYERRQESTVLASAWQITMGPVHRNKGCASDAGLFGRPSAPGPNGIAFDSKGNA